MACISSVLRDLSSNDADVAISNKYYYLVYQKNGPSFISASFPREKRVRDPDDAYRVWTDLNDRDVDMLTISQR